MRIRIAGEFVDMPTGFTMPWEAVNPVFDFGSLTGNKGWRFTLPPTATNNSILGFRNQISTTEVPDGYPAEIIIDGGIIDEGMATVEKTTENGYEMTFGQGLATMFGDITNTKINELPLGSEPANDITTHAYDGDLLKWCRPVVGNTVFYGNAAPGGYAGQMNAYADEEYAALARVPMLGFLWTLKQIASLAGYSIQGEVMTNPAMQQLHFVSLRDLGEATTLTYAAQLPEMTVRELWLELSLPPLGIVPFVDTSRKIIVLKQRDGFFRQDISQNLSSRVDSRILPQSKESSRIELAMDLDGNDALMKTPPEGLKTYQSPGAGNLFSLKGKISTCSMAEGLPTMEQAGVTATNNQLTAKFSPKLLFWLGMVEDQPMSSSSTEGYSLGFTGDDNLVTRFWKNFEANRKVTVPVELKARLTANELEQLNFHKNAGAFTAFYAHGQAFLVESVRATLPVATEMVTIRAWRL